MKEWFCENSTCFLIEKPDPSFLEIVIDWFVDINYIELLMSFGLCVQSILLLFVLVLVSAISITLTKDFLKSFKK